MPMIIPFIPLIAAGLGAAGSAVASKSKTSTSTPILSPGLQQGQDASLASLMKILQNPSAGLAPVQSAGADKINTGFANLPKTATQQLSARGFGSSGQVGDAVYNVAGAKQSSLSELYSQIAKMSSDRELNANSIMNSMIATGKGTATTAPGNSVGAGLLTGANDLSSLSALMTLTKMLNTGGGSSSGNIGGVPGPGTSIPDLLGSGAKSYPVDQTGWGN